MIKLKAAALSQMGVKHLQNDDSVSLNEKEGIYIICDGVSEGGQGKLASELITKIIQEKLIKANSDFKKNESNLIGTKRLLAMQEVMQNTFAEAQSTLSGQAKTNPLYKKEFPYHRMLGIQLRCFQKPLCDLQINTLNMDQKT